MQTEREKKLSETYKKKWQDPEYRALMLEKQKRIGYRSYGDGIFYSQYKKKKY